MEAWSYDERVGRHFRLDRAPTLKIGSRKGLKLAVTRLRSDRDDHGEIAPLPREDSFAVILYLRDASSHRAWLDGRELPHCFRSYGDVCVTCLEHAPAAYLETPFDWLVFQVPRAALDNVAHEAGARPIEALVAPNGVGPANAVTARLGLCLLPAIEHPKQLNRLFIEHVASALCAHFAETYGQMRIPDVSVGRLAPWQERRATEILNANLDGDVSIAEVASECGLSQGHFGRAFKRSTGLSPHRWLLQRRVDRAKDLLRNSDLPIVEIALACGFAEQSHFTKIFSRNVGESPGAWRRQRSSG